MIDFDKWSGRGFGRQYFTLYVRNLDFTAGGDLLHTRPWSRF
jgi:hypothetical protein